MRKIIKASYMDYLFLFGDFRTVFSDLSAKSANENGMLYILLDNNLPAGYICAEKNENLCTVLYGYIVPDKRNSGIFSQLLRFVTEKVDCDVKLSIAENRDSFPIAKHTAEKLGFKLDSSCILFSGKIEDLSNWEKYMAETGDKFCGILLRQDYRCVSFADADIGLLKSLYNSGISDFQNHLDIRPYLEQKSKCTDMEMSFIAVKNDTVAAYTLVRRPDKKSAVFEHISVHEKYIGSGCILLPFAKSIKMFKTYNCRRAVYAMYEENSHANAFRKKLLERVTSSQKRSYNYIFHTKEVSCHG